MWIAIEGASAPVTPLGSITKASYTHEAAKEGSFGTKGILLSLNRVIRSHGSLVGL